MTDIDAAVHDRALGCLLGLAVGDAVGTTLEFSIRDSRPPLTDMIGGGPFHLKPGEWTDDTSMALCLADSLIACGDLNERDLMDRFLRWYEDGENSVTGVCFDIGIQTRNALVQYDATSDPFAGPTNPQAGGNGSIMRLAPVALRWHDNRADAIDAARRQSRTTHGAPEPVEASALLAEILVDLIASGDRSFITKSRSSSDRRIDLIAKGGWQRTRDEIRSSGYVVDTLEAALWATNSSQNFEEAILLAANLGDDSDTVAAVTGQIAGALWGQSGIPTNWLDRLAWRQRIESDALKLLKIANAPMSGS